MPPTTDARAKAKLHQLELRVSGFSVCVEGAAQSCSCVWLCQAATAALHCTFKHVVMCHTACACSRRRRRRRRRRLSHAINSKSVPQTRALAPAPNYDVYVQHELQCFTVNYRRDFNDTAPPNSSHPETANGCVRSDVFPRQWTTHKTTTQGTHNYCCNITVVPSRSFSHSL